MGCHNDFFEVEAGLHFLFAGVFEGGASVDKPGISHKEYPLMRPHPPLLIIIMLQKKYSKPQSQSKDPSKRVKAKIKYHPSQLTTIINSIYCYYDYDGSDYLKKT